MASCGERKFLDGTHDTLLNPVLIIEVLSKSTEACDRGRKFANYRTLESLQQYMLVSQDRVQVESFLRQPDNRWLLTVADRLEDTVDLDSISCRLLLADIYEDLELASGAPGGSLAGERRQPDQTATDQ